MRLKITDVEKKKLAQMSEKKTLMLKARKTEEKVKRVQSRGQSSASDLSSSEDSLAQYFSDYVEKEPKEKRTKVQFPNIK